VKTRLVFSFWPARCSAVISAWAEAAAGLSPTRGVTGWAGDLQGLLRFLSRHGCARRWPHGEVSLRVPPSELASAAPRSAGSGLSGKPAQPISSPQEESSEAVCESIREHDAEAQGKKRAPSVSRAGRRTGPETQMAKKRIPYSRGPYGKKY